jgi:hypothetical protein
MKTFFFFFSNLYSTTFLLMLLMILKVEFYLNIISGTFSCIVYSESPGYFEINKERDIIAE